MICVKQLHCNADYMEKLFGELCHRRLSLNLQMHENLTNFNTIKSLSDGNCISSFSLCINLNEANHLIIRKKIANSF